MTQLSSLMRTINATDVHYVRCIKPNTLNKPAQLSHWRLKVKPFSLEHCDTFRPAIFDMAHSAHQLRCAGVLEAVRISRMAYPNRMPHASFVSRYALLAPSEWQAAHEVDMARARAAAPGDESARALCEGALALVVEDVARYQLGKTKVFFRAFLLEALEQRRGNALATYAVVVQKMLRSALWSRRFRLLRLSSVRLQALRRRQVQLSEYRRQRAAAIALAAAGRGLRARILRRRLLAAVRIQAAGRAAAARDRVYHLRRRLCATRLQAAVRSHRHRSAFTARRGAALRLQSKARMASQRRAYLRDLAEKKEEAKLSTQLAKLQARLQAEMEARQNAERALEAGAAADEGSGSGAAVAGDGGGVAGIAGAAASWVLGNMGGPSTSVEETSTMLSVVTKDRERLGQRLAAETEARKRLEAEKRELERKLNMGSATSQVETRSHRQIAEALSRTKDEVGEKTRIMQNQTIEIANLQNTKTALERRILALEKKISQYDDSFYALEARNVRDKTRMEEMGKAKSRAEEEKNICRLMLEQAHERWLKERSDLRKDALQKIQTNAARVREQRMQIAELQQAHRAQRQLAEEAKMYKEQCTVLMEKLSRAGVGGGTTPAASPGGVPSPRARPGGAVAAPLKAPSAANLLEKMKSSVSSSGLLGRATSKESPRAPPPAPDAP